MHRFLFALDPEAAHGLALGLLALWSERGPLLEVPARLLRVEDPRLRVEAFGVSFPNPLGLAAGMDKDARALGAWWALGFGFAEVGTLTPRPQVGNPKPRLFRLVEDRALINRMGFNNGGQAAALPRLQASQGRGLIGVNIGANKDAVDRIADYAMGVRQMAPVASYLTVNISSPNTPGLRALQDEGALTELLCAVRDARPADGPPVFLKVAPDLEPADIDAIARLSVGMVDGLIVSNTTISRPTLSSGHAAEGGGLSGAPLRDLAQQRMRDFAKATGLTLDLTARGMGLRSNRYSMLIKDGKVATLNIEGPGKFEVSDADTMLSQAKA